MKKILVVLSVVLCLSGCGGGVDTSQTSAPPLETAVVETTAVESIAEETVEEEEPTTEVIESTEEPTQSGYDEESYSAKLTEFMRTNLADYLEQSEYTGLAWRKGAGSPINVVLRTLNSRGQDYFIYVLWSNDSESYNACDAVPEQELRAKGGVSVDTMTIHDPYICNDNLVIKYDVKYKDDHKGDVCFEPPTLGLDYDTIYGGTATYISVLPCDAKAWTGESHIMEYRPFEIDGTTMRHYRVDKLLRVCGIPAYVNFETFWKDVDIDRANGTASKGTDEELVEVLSLFRDDSSEDMASYLGLELIDNTTYQGLIEYDPYSDYYNDDWFVE